MCVLFIHPSVDGLLGCFYLLALVNNAAVNMGVQIDLEVPAFNSLMYISRSGVAESYSNSNFNYLFSIVAASIYIATKSARGFSFHHIFALCFC